MWAWPLSLEETAYAETDFVIDFSVTPELLFLFSTGINSWSFLTIALMVRYSPSGASALALVNYGSLCRSVTADGLDVLLRGCPVPKPGMVA